ncbi:hypothetical protein FRB96_006073 [Tulasnella sp. 330]|nr:hypothetical protein FRB96_006073 [Tulasnella sp. 330]KAG8875907.1 hypothetical protein FRB97_004643 [Tulasnella sp. 331]KAG8889532.1 hypothetical protein FRB98_004006 [Tulasnella sp. 332]
MAPVPVPKARRKSEMRIELPRPDFGQFKEPAAPQNGAQPAQPAGAGQQAPAKMPPLGQEVLQMHTALKNATVKAGEIARFHADTRRLGLPPGEPVPKPLTSAISNELAKFDQCRDILEAHILHSITILTRELNRQKAARAAADARDRNSQVAESSSTEGASSVANMEGLTATPQQASETSDIRKDDAMMEQTKEVEGKDVVETEPTSESENAAAARRASSPGPTAVSLSVLPQVSPDLTTTQLTTQTQDGAGGAARLGRSFPLKLDLSSTALRQTFPTALGVDDGGVERPPSPVRLAPRPRADDPVSALMFPGPSPFGSTLPPYSSQPGSAFSSTSALPLASVVANAMSGAGGSLPGILSAFAGAGGGSGRTEMPNDSANQQQMMNFSESDPLSQTLSSQEDVIDLTQPTPVLETGMSLPMNGGNPDETIDLTMDSPTIPLSQLVTTNKGNTGGTDFTTEEFGLEDEGEKGGDGQQQAGGEGQDSLDGLLSSFVNPQSQGLSGQSFANSDTATQSSNSIIPTDATSVLASLTGSSGPGNQFSGLGMSDPSGLNALDDLNLSNMTFSNMDGMDGMSFGGGNGAGSDVSFGGGTDIGGMSSLYMPGDFGDANGLKDGAVSDSSDPLRDLMGDDDSGAMGGVGMDFSAFLSDMSGNGEAGIGGGDLTGQNGNK